VQVEADMERLVGHDGPRRCATTRVGGPETKTRQWRVARVACGDPDPQRHRPDSELRRWAEVYRLAVSTACRRHWAAAAHWRRCLGGGQALAVGSGAHLGLHAAGGDRVGRCSVVAFALAGVASWHRALGLSSSQHI